MKLFDYIYYRVYTWYESRDNMPWMYAAGIITVIQSFLIIDITVLLQIVTAKNIFPVVPKYILWLIAITVLGINIIFYSNIKDINKIKSKYSNERYNSKKRNGYVLILVLILLISFPMIYGYLKHNLGVLE